MSVPGPAATALLQLMAVSGARGVAAGGKRGRARPCSGGVVRAGACTGAHLRRGVERGCQRPDPVRGHPRERRPARPGARHHDDRPAARRSARANGVRSARPTRGLTGRLHHCRRCHRAACRRPVSGTARPAGARGVPQLPQAAPLGRQPHSPGAVPASADARRGLGLHRNCTDRSNGVNRVRVEPWQGGVTRDGLGTATLARRDSRQLAGVA